MYSPPEKFQIDKVQTIAMKKGNATITAVKVEGSIMPLTFQIKKFFEKATLLEDAIENTKTLENLNSQLITNFVQGELWKEKTEFKKDQLNIPYFLYSDDMETGDPLSGHCGSQALCNFFYSFPTLPSGSSILDNIFLFSILKSKDMKEYGNEKCLHKIVHEIVKLEEEGIDFNVEGVKTKVFFILGVVAGDNLALNSILGFSPGFNHNYFCRICKTKKTISLLPFSATGEIRNPENYEKDLTDTYQNTGVREKSPLNKIPSFHVTKNFSSDLMHDCFEGVIKYGMVSSVKYFIEDKKYFDLPTLNKRMKFFNYGQCESYNIPPPIKLSHLKNCRLHFSAMESYKFLFYFLLYISDLIPKDDAVYQYVLYLQELMELIVSRAFSERMILLLDEKIKIHNNLYCQIFETNLKPKHHIISHYPLIIRKSGPIIHLWCMRFEAKNREIKNYTNVTFSRKNLPFSVTKKCFLKFSALILRNSKIAPVCEILKFSKELCPQHYISLLSNSNPLTHVKVVQSFKYNNTVFKTNYHIFLMQELFLIEAILNIDNNISCILRKIEILHFDSNLRAYIVGNPTDVLSVKVFKNCKDFIKPISLFKLFDKILFKPHLF